MVRQPFKGIGTDSANGTNGANSTDNANGMNGANRTDSANGTNSTDSAAGGDVAPVVCHRL